MWAVVKAALSPRANETDITVDHLDSKIITRITIDPDLKIWMIPLKSLVKPCYVVWNKNYCDGSSDKDVKEHDNTAYIVDPYTFWPQNFLHSD